MSVYLCARGPRTPGPTACRPSAVRLTCVRALYEVESMCGAVLKADHSAERVALSAVFPPWPLLLLGPHSQRYSPSVWCILPLSGRFLRHHFTRGGEKGHRWNRLATRFPTRVADGLYGGCGQSFSAWSIGMCRSAAQEVGRFGGPRSCVSQRSTFSKETRRLRWTGASSSKPGRMGWQWTRTQSW